MASLTTDNNDQKKESSEKRTLNDSSTPPLSPMPNNTDVDFDPNLLSVNTTTTNGGSNSASLSSVSPSKRQKRDAKNISSSPNMEKYLNPFQDKWSSREDFNPKPQVRSAPQDAEVGTAGDKLVLVMVGLPARGKTYIARRVARYLQFFHGAPTKVFNVGNYRREISGAKVGSSFFSNKNAKSLAERQKAAEYAMRDLKQWLQEKNDKGRVGIFDATNTTKERREWIIQELAGIMESKSHIIFVESICNNEDIINENIRAVKLNMPDYKGENPEKAVEDFKKRIENYESIYQPISDEELSWVRLVDAGRQVTMNNIKGFLAGRVVQFLINLHFHPRPIYLSRHGQSEYNKLQKVGGDSGLSPAGEEYALALAKYVDEHILVDKIDGIDGNPMHARLFTSSLRRTKLTARHIKHDTLDDGWIVMRPKVLRNLDEIYAGVFDGYTYKEIQTVAPEEFEARSRNKLTYRYPRGESYLDVIDRLAPVIQEIERTKDPILIVGHQGILRIIYSYFMDYPREKAPFEKIPLNTIIKLIPDTYDCKEERKCLIPMSNEDKNTPSH
tara:strand:- start:65 stop:1738 length:1674 start_codon:yes stop_codon:yes gene_type:complete